MEKIAEKSNSFQIPGIKNYSGRNCSAAEFRCGDGRCVNVGWVCDGTTDCEDGLDEKNCAKPTCHPMEEFMCGNGRCVPVGWRCDGDADCVDSSDELVPFTSFFLDHNRCQYCVIIMMSIFYYIQMPKSSIRRGTGLNKYCWFGSSAFLLLFFAPVSVIATFSVPLCQMCTVVFSFFV